MERISTHQFLTIGAAVLMGTTFLPVASLVTGVGGRDGWMSVLPGFAVGIPYGLMVLSLVERYPHKNLLQISETLFGKWIGKIIGVIYIDHGLLWRIVARASREYLSEFDYALNPYLGVLPGRTVTRFLLGKVWNRSVCTLF